MGIFNKEIFNMDLFKDDEEDVKEEKKAEQITKEVKKVKVLGVRGVDVPTAVVAREESLFCLLVLYVDNTRGLVECTLEEFEKKYMNYIEM